MYYQRYGLNRNVVTRPLFYPASELAQKVETICECYVDRLTKSFAANRTSTCGRLTKCSLKTPCLHHSLKNSLMTLHSTYGSSPTPFSTALLLPTQQGQELLSCLLLVSETSQHCTGGRTRSSFLDPSAHHAHVLGLDDHSNTAGFQNL